MYLRTVICQLVYLFACATAQTDLGSLGGRRTLQAPSSKQSPFINLWLTNNSPRPPPQSSSPKKAPPPTTTSPSPKKAPPPTTSSPSPKKSPPPSPIVRDPPRSSPPTRSPPPSPVSRPPSPRRSPPPSPPPPTRPSPPPPKPPPPSPAPSPPPPIRSPPRRPPPPPPSPLPPSPRPPVLLPSTKAPPPTNLVNNELSAPPAPPPPALPAPPPPPALPALPPPPAQPAQPARPPRPIRGGCEDGDASLARTNDYRARHAAVPMAWNDTLAASSQSYARQLARAGCSLQHSDDFSFGENILTLLQYPKPSGSCAEAIDGWYGEVYSYKFTDTPYSDNAGMGVFHFSQLVWEGSTSMGCGMAMADTDIRFPNKEVLPGGCKVIVCRYYPSGNIPSDELFAANVLPPT